MRLPSFRVLGLGLLEETRGSKGSIRVLKGSFKGIYKGCEGFRNGSIRLLKGSFKGICKGFRV